MRLTVAVPYFAISARRPSTTAGCALSASIRTARVVDDEAMTDLAREVIGSVLPAGASASALRCREPEPHRLWENIHIGASVPGRSRRATFDDSVGRDARCDGVRPNRQRNGFAC